MKMRIVSLKRSHSVSAGVLNARNSRIIVIQV